MRDLVTALGLALLLEGVAYALFPQGMRQLMKQVFAQPPQLLRLAGLAAAAAGLAVVAAARAGFN